MCAILGFDFRKCRRQKVMQAGSAAMFSSNNIKANPVLVVFTDNRLEIFMPDWNRP
jgi:hypothetical protein